MQVTARMIRGWVVMALVLSLSLPQLSSAQYIATTTVTLSVCGNSLIEGSEECDVPGETGVYSTTIAGRQCDTTCFFGPYCGDTILQVGLGETCDDGNNESGDFCSADCQIEPAGTGGGGGGGGGGSSGGGSNVDLGDTQINVSGQAYPGETVHILLDGEEVGTVRADSDGDFDFATLASPGTATLGFWSLDSNNVRSITFNTTFDVTQGAITNVNGILLPPTLVVSDQTANPGDVLTLSGQAVPGTTVEIHLNDSEQVFSVTANSDGEYTYIFDTSSTPAAEYALKARYVVGSGNLTTESSFSTSIQLFLGVDGSPTTPSDLSRDGFVNLIDFSILIFWWQTNGGDSDPPADINGNGNVSLEDFSILLFNWTG